MAVTDKLFVLFQRVLPKTLLGRIAYRVSRSRRPWLKNALIRCFVRAYAVDTTEMGLANPIDYPSFNAFFTRELCAGARPIDEHPDAICSPADGTVQQIGHIEEGQLFQAKGIFYRLTDLLGVDRQDTVAFAGGAFLTIYLAPHNYHRVHMPLEGVISGMRYLPGRRLAVNEATVRSVPGLFAVNERLAVFCGGDRGPYWIVFVGAMNVASISTAWAGEVLPHTHGEPYRQAYDDAQAVALRKGDYCGHFNMGSTVIIVLPDQTVAWDPALAPGDPLRVGQRVGTLLR